MPITVELSGDKTSGLCPCCGSISRTVWGWIIEDDVYVAAYYVHWTKDEVVRHGAHFDLILGEWGEGSDPAERLSVSLAYRIFDTGPSFMVIDAADRPTAKSPISGQPLARDEVIGTCIAEVAFAAVDNILFQDPRVAELTPQSGR